MFETNDVVKARGISLLSRSSERDLIGVVVREMAGGEYVIVNFGWDYDVRVKSEDLEVVQNG